MAAADKATIKAGSSGYELMNRAARAVVDEAQKRFDIRSALVLCGPGNNGGDGLVIARLLRDSGYPVRVAVLKDEFKGEEAKQARKDWDGNVYDLAEIEPDPHDLIIDALFRTGFSGDLPETVQKFFNCLSRKSGNPDDNAVRSPLARGKQNCIVAVDMPSGVRADLTVTFQYKKLAHVLYPGAGLCGELVVRDIGITEADDYAALENAPALWADQIPRKTANTHKYDYGHALIYGAPELTGATRLAAEACARMGAGLTTVLGGEKGDVYRAALPAHIIVRDDPGWMDERISARLYGPGGLPCEVDFRQEIPTVLDADALADLPEKLSGDYILTPHEGEFAKAFPGIKGSKLEKARQAAQQSGAIILLKGPDTVIAHPDGRAVINTHSSGHLATAGTGDVLAGMITGLLALGMEPFDAACAAVWLHGEAGREIGAGLVASDLLKSLKKSCHENHTLF